MSRHYLLFFALAAMLAASVQGEQANVAMEASETVQELSKELAPEEDETIVAVAQQLINDLEIDSEDEESEDASDDESGDEWIASTDVAQEDEVDLSDRRVLASKSASLPSFKSTKAPTIKSTKAPTIKSTKAPSASSVKSKSRRELMGLYVEDETKDAKDLF